VLKLKTAWYDGTTHIVMSPLEFMPRLAALVTHGAAPADDRFEAVNLGHQTPGLGRVPPF
jgi:hypothetical protein